MEKCLDMAAGGKHDILKDLVADLRNELVIRVSRCRRCAVQEAEIATDVVREFSPNISLDDLVERDAFP